MNHFSAADAMSALLIYLLLGACAGVLAGLLGIGGGLVLVGALAWLLPMQGVPADAAMHVALASSLASIVLTAAASARAHHRRGSVLWPTVAWMVPGVLLGGWFALQGTLFLALLVLLSTRLSRWPALGVLVNGYIWLMRGTPLMLQMLFIYFALPFVPVIGVRLPDFPSAVLAFG